MSSSTAGLRTARKPVLSKSSTLPAARGGLLQRKCACGGASGMDGQCADCRENELGLQHFASDRGGPALAPPIVHEVLRSPGQPLNPATRALMEPHFGHDFSRVRVHTDETAARSARAVNAIAYAVGRHVVFGRGKFSPNSSTGRWLLAHELAHVVQQSSGGAEAERQRDRLDIAQADGAAEQEADRYAQLQTGTEVQRQRTAKSIQRQAEGATAAPPAPKASEPEQEQRKSLDAEWYIEIDPATPIIAAGTMVIFRLRNSLGEEFSWEVERPSLGRRPVFTLREPNGHELVLSTPTRPQEIRYPPEQPGHYKATFRGRPRRFQDPENPGALTTTGSEITVSVEFDVSRTLGPEVLEGEGALGTERADIAQLQRPDAAEGEIAAAFQRIAVRLGFQVLEKNRQEAEEQLKLYTTGSEGKTSTQATDDLAAVFRLYQSLDEKHGQITFETLSVSLRQGAREGYTLKSVEDVIKYRQERKEKIEKMQEGLIDAFPAIAIVSRSPVLGPIFQRNPEKRQAVIELGLRRVLANIEATKRNLATGDMEILRVSPVVAEARDMLGIDADPRKKQAIDGLLKEHGAEEFKRGLAVTGATIFLLFIPGIGPYLAAGLSATWATRSWIQTGELRAAAGAGVRGGIVEHGEAAAGAFWALIDTLGAGLDLGTALSTVRRIAPHVPEAIERVAARSGKRMVVEEAVGPAGKAGPAAERTAPIAPGKGKGVEGVGLAEPAYEMPRPAQGGEAGLSFEEQVNQWIDEILAGEQTSGAKPLVEAPTAKAAVSVAEQVKPITYKQFMEEIGRIDITAVKENKGLSSRLDALWEGYLKRKGTAPRLFQDKDQYIRFRHGLDSGQLSPEFIKGFFAGRTGLSHPASEAGRVAERIWEEVLVTTEKNTEKYTVTFIDPLTNKKLTVNMVPDFMPTGTVKGGKFASATKTKVKEALVIADSKFTWDASKKVVLDDQVRGMLALARELNKPFVFLLKEGGEVAPAVKRFAEALGVDWHVARDISGLIK